MLTWLAKRHRVDVSDILRSPAEAAAAPARRVYVTAVDGTPVGRADAGASDLHRLIRAAPQKYRPSQSSLRPIHGRRVFALFYRTPSPFSGPSTDRFSNQDL
jgi:hypothetical protein